MDAINTKYGGTLNNMEITTVNKSDAIYRAFDGLINRLESRAGGSGGGGSNNVFTFAGLSTNLVK